MYLSKLIDLVLEKNLIFCVHYTKVYFKLKNVLVLQFLSCFQYMDRRKTYIPYWSDLLVGL